VIAASRRSAGQVVRPGPAWLCLAYAMTTPTSLRDRLRGGEAAYGGWLTIPDLISARMLALAGLDYVVIDLQHGSATEHDLPSITTAARYAGATPIGRVRYAHPADIGRALDLGCQGVIVPNVESAAQAATVAGACRYPPVGYRSAGGNLATADPLCFIMVESPHAVGELAATLAVEGVDGIYVGPRDLSLSLGCALDPNDPVLRKELERIWAACAAAGKPVGVHATDGATGRLYREHGCQLITVTADALAVSRTAASELAAARG
jgi:4-hydroxy-2-oxoheptanedioate aldolase